ncbi:ABC transporter permease [Maribacter aestuarii]|uniref:ABC transporter permease n=1 Tax=Maribacter aestuarii TaxID=1130723 RepID=UPI00248B1AFB|nr:FtsX-like permease family protein [Maribacter aestuarii]
MLVQIAWRNIWRNKTRSLVVICSIIIGLWAGVFILAFAWGLYQNNIDDSVFRQLSHIQIHHPLFDVENESKYALSRAKEIVAELQSDDRVHSVSSRVIATGMITSPTTASGVKVFGIEPAVEKEQIRLHENLVEGSYFETGKENELLIGVKLAKKLKVKLKSKVVLMFTNVKSEMVSAAFRVGGIYRSKNISLDEVHVYVPQDHLGKLLFLKPDESNEIAILLNDEKQLAWVKERSKRLVPQGKVEDWKALSPELSMVIDSFNMYTYIVTGIILLALTFGIINTMLMSVLERVRELGMLMAIGLNKTKLFSMIMLETLYLTLIGCPIGLLIGWASIAYLGKQGIDISMFSEGLSSYGFTSIIYPALENQKYGIVAVMFLITALISALYPAYRALQLNPSEAIRKI